MFSHRQLRGWALAVALTLSSQLLALEITVNGRRDRTYPTEILVEMSAPVPTAAGLRMGVSLLEVLPLALSCDRITVRSSSGSVIWEGEDLAEELAGGMILVDSPQIGTVEIEFLGRRVSRVSAVDMRADLVDERQLDVWLSWEGVSLLKKEIARFADLHNCSISAVEVPNIRSKLIAILRGGGRPPDLIMVQSDYLSVLTEAKALQPVRNSHYGELAEKGWESMTLSGDIWAVPFYFDAQLVFINRKALANDLPADWDLEDFETFAETLKSAGWTPASWNAYSAYWLPPFVAGFGKTDMHEPDGSIRVDDGYTVEAVKYIKSLQDRGLLEVLERDAMITGFVRGRIGLILSGSYSIPQFERLGLDFAVVSFPRNSTLGRDLAPFLDFKAFAVTRRAANPILARRLVQHLTGFAVQQRFTTALAKLPANQAAWSNMAGEHRYYQALDESYRRGAPVPPTRGYSIYKNTMWKLLRLILSDQMPVEEALRKGQEVLDANAPE